MNTDPQAAYRVRAAIDAAERSMKWTAEKAGIPVPTLRRKLGTGGDFTVSEIGRSARALGVHPLALLPDAYQDLPSLERVA